MRWGLRSLLGGPFVADFLAGAALAAFVAAVAPGLRKQLRPLAVALAADALDVADGARSWVARLKEDLTDLVAEAHFVRRTWTSPNASSPNGSPPVRASFTRP